MKPVLADALAKLERRKSQPADAREQFTHDEIQLLWAWTDKRLRKLERRSDRSARNKEAWAAGDRSQWGG